MNDQQAMLQACELAKNSPAGMNPQVGAVVVSQNEIVGWGHHMGIDTEHAEAVAMNMAGEKARGATLYISLEPCRHQGKTPPCTDMILQSGITRVVYAIHDPHLLASGGGEYLHSHGIDIAYDVCKKEAEEINKEWLISVKRQRPYVTMKVAMSMDGFIVDTEGESKWITSEQARLDSHYYRLRAGAILIGNETLQKDNPNLSIRIDGFKNERYWPIPVVMGKRNIPDESNIRQRTFLQYKTHDPHVILQRLYDEGINHVLLEGGRTVWNTFLNESLVDQLVIYMAPIFLGDGTKAFQMKKHSLKRPFAMQYETLEYIGRDIKITALLDSSL